jgi:uncharacterized protein
MAGRQGKAERRDGSFDAYDLVRRRASVAGKFDAASLPRAADQLAPDCGSAEVAWRISGIVDPSGRPALGVQVDGTVPLVCQRCLQPFAWHVAQQTTVLLARDERELEMLDAEDEHEVILAAAPLDAVTLAEDELLLTLPFVPRCERVECVQSALAGAHDSRARAPTAFAALAAIKPGDAKKGRNRN